MSNARSLRPAARPPVPAALPAAVLVAVLVIGLTTGCSDVAVGPLAPQVGSAHLDIDGERIALEVVTCGLIGGRFPERVPQGGSETTLTATGRTGEGAPVSVLVRRTHDIVPPEQVQTVEIALGDPQVAVRALILYRGLDETTGQWTEIDPAVADPRVPVPGPLIAVSDASLRAEGSASLPEDGRRVVVRLDARCPVEVDGTPGIA